MKVTLEGEANDYVAKGMNGGKIVIVPHPDFKGRSDVNFGDQVREEDKPRRPGLCYSMTDVVCLRDD